MPYSSSASLGAFNGNYVQFLALQDLMPQLLAAKGTGFPQGQPPLAAELRAAGAAAQAQGDFLNFQTGGLVGSTLQENLKPETQGGYLNSGQRAAAQMHAGKACTAAGLKLLARYVKNILSKGHFMHGRRLP